MMWRFGVLLGCVVASPAGAYVATTQQVTLAVAEVTEHDVGFAIGVACDDPGVVAATMHARTPETNVLVLRGLREGRTTCRAGTDPYRASILFEIRVTPARRPADR